MPGTILIVNDIVTNRIATKVKLAAACYQVAQAANGASGLEAARRLRPDVILCSSHLPDMAVDDFARALREAPQTRDISLVVETTGGDAGFRHGVLEAGADDVLLKPYDDQLLLARLRSLLRSRETTEELMLREGASRALGLSEPATGFARPGRIALIAPSADIAALWSRRLEHHFPGQLTAFALKDAMKVFDHSPAPDAVALIMTAETAVAGQQLLADLRAKPDTRDAGVLAMIEGASAQRMAAEALDRGANDVITEAFGPREIVLRLNRLIARKHTLERLRADMRDGLRVALTDPLTGLFNRRHALPRMEKIAESAMHGGRDFAAMIIDVDHFKMINDRFGHANGDTVLVRLAEVLRETVGDGDLLARIGGEEFLVVLPDCSRSAAQLAAKRLCHAVRKSAFPLPGRARPLQVTVSIGVALLSDVQPPMAKTVTPTSSPGQDQPLHEAVLERADKALFGAKALGRNQVTLSTARSAA